jgi:hypothetical protein
MQQYSEDYALGERHGGNCRSWLGGNAGPVWPRNNIFLGLPVTAIAIAYVKSGFAIAADGRRRWADQTSVDEDAKQQESETQQKIFPAKFKGRDIAFALTGLVSSADKTFDLIKETRAAADSLERSNTLNLYDYVEAFSASIRTALNGARQDGRIDFGDNSFCSDPEERNTVARIFFIGYFRKDEPSLAVVKLSHNGQVIGEPSKLFQSPPENPVLSGSSIAELMYGRNDQRFAKYARPLSRDSSMEQAKDYARNFIEACSDPLAREIDRACDGIGGRIHMATITKQEGFRWVPGFEPSGRLDFPL